MRGPPFVGGPAYSLELVTRFSGQVSAAASAERVLQQIVGGITTLIATASLSLLAVISSATCLYYISLLTKIQSILKKIPGV